MTKTTEYVIGLDLGQLSDRTALSVIEDVTTAAPAFVGQLTPDTDVYKRPEAAMYACRHLQVWNPGTQHTDVLRDVVALLQTPPMRSEPNKRFGATVEVHVAIDVTVSGPFTARMFTDALQEASDNVSITTFEIVSGLTQTGNPYGSVRVPKRDLASLLRVLLESKRLVIAQGIQHGATLRSEISNFKAEKITPDDSVLDWRTREHDDLVLATALALWMFEKRGRAFFYG